MKSSSRMKIRPRQQKLVDAYLRTGSIEKATTEADYSNADNALRVFKIPGVKNYMIQQQQAAQKHAQLQHADVVDCHQILVESAIDRENRVIKNLDAVGYAQRSLEEIARLCGFHAADKHVNVNVNADIDIEQVRSVTDELMNKYKRDY
jgi:phage terminase small subunit